jgi:hypothetical protein
MRMKKLSSCAMEPSIKMTSTRMDHKPVFDIYLLDQITLRDEHHCLRATAGYLSQNP